MNYPLDACLALLILLSFGSVPRAQDNAEPAPIPPRYCAIAKTPHTRLLEVFGTPEVQPAFGPTAAYSANGKWAVFASTLPIGDESAPANTLLFVWDVEAGKLRKEIPLPGRAVTALGLTADGSRALLGALSGDAKSKTLACPLVLIDLTTGKELRSFGKHPNPIYALALSPDGTRALSGTLGALKHWDVDQGKELAPLAVPADKLVAAVAFLPGGKQALSGWDAEVRLWDLTDGKEKHAYKPKTSSGPVLGLAVAADGKHFGAAGFEMGASLWDTDSAKEVTAWSVPSITQNPVAASLHLTPGDSGLIVCWGFLNADGSRESALVCHFDQGKTKETWSKSVPLRGMVPSQLNGKILRLGGGANPFCVWDPHDGKELRRWGGPKGPITSLARSADGSLLSASTDGMIFRCKAGQQVDGWRGHDSAITALATSKDCKRLLSASSDKTVKLHDAVKGIAVCTLEGHADSVTSVVFGDGDRWAASGSEDRTVILWDLKEGKKRQVLEGHAGSVNAVAVSPRADWLASASSDKTIRLWPIKDATADPDREAVVLEGHKREVTCVAFSADGKQLLSAGQDRALKLWDVATQKVVREFTGHKNWITAAVFQGPDRVLSGSDDLVVCVWDVATGKELDRIDLAAVSDGPRSLLSLSVSEFAVGTSGWVVMRCGLAK
jgi:WD40 repeat protein